jgi:L-alanine-DL-glutamate epimerase-like enolase superfamily enzyme
MKIRTCRHWTEPLSLTRPYRIANRTISDVENHFVRIEAENGICGYGSASPGDHVTGESLQDCESALNQHLNGCLQDADLRAFPALTRRLREALARTPAALAAVDMAMYDLSGKLLGLPLVDLLGRCHQSLPTSITLGIQSIDQALVESEEYIGRGFTLLKVKIGESLEDDIALLSKLREKVGPRIGIRVDANQGYSVSDMISFHRQTRHLDLELIEQPLPASQLDAMRDLPEEIRVRCAGDESVCGPFDALACSHPPRPFGIYNIKLMKCGGITSALEMARTARLAGIDLMWGCNDESCVSIAAALHAAMACPATRYIDLDGSFDLGRDLFLGGFTIEKGTMRTVDAPGLGVTPNISLE